MCNNCDRGHYLTHFPFLLTLLCLYMPSCHNPLQISKQKPFEEIASRSVISRVKEFFLMTRIWPHFICISLHQSRQHPSSLRSVFHLTVFHIGATKHIHGACNCLIRFGPCSFTLGWPCMKSTIAPLKETHDLIDLHYHFLFHQSLLDAKGHLWQIWDICLSLFIEMSI